jgi:prepilin-type N-terminal cleavage/methylation domain-containing protein
MKKAFTLIELIFVIVIIGVLASVAIPKFKNLTTHAKSSGVKSVVTSIQSSIDNIHGQWIINDNYKWIGADGKDHTEDFNNSTGYPKKLDDGSKLFSYVLKVPIPACSDGKTNGCWKEEEDKKYSYYYSSSKVLKIEYNATNGTLECLDGVNINKTKCEEIIY